VFDGDGFVCARAVEVITIMTARIPVTAILARDVLIFIG
jgi:hypothetical protein